MRVLVTGATGYIGGRLVPRLIAAGHQVTCLTRDARRLRDVPWRDQVDVVTADVVSGDGLTEALTGIDVAFYLVHSLNSRRFEDLDRQAAQHFALAAAQCDLGRIIYLGGPQPPEHASAHLRSRAEVADILLASGVPTVVLRAAVILGSGSASFEMLRYLTERLPLMITPRWVTNRVQPIAVRDVLRYLVEAVDLPAGINRGFDIGGPDVLTYADLMHHFAAVAGLRRRVIMPLRVLTPRLSAHWVGLVTPVPHAIARPLVASLAHEAVCHEHDIDALIPPPPTGLIGVDEALQLAQAKVRDAAVETRWSGAVWPGAASPADPLPSDPDWSGGSVYRDVRSRASSAPPEQLWRVIESVGGANGWYSFPLAWAVRGWLDRAVGGAGLNRGRRDPAHLRLGEALDFWRVDEISPGRLLRLRAEMRLPGVAWLELCAEPTGDGHSRYRQKATFVPHGLAGHLYWAMVWPFHAVVFGGMARNITARAARATQQPTGVV